jgi:hypothetical protein
MDYGLRFEPSDNSVRLTDLTVNTLQFAGAPAIYQPFVNGLGPPCADRLMKDFTLHKSASQNWPQPIAEATRKGAFRSRRRT